MNKTPVHALTWRSAIKTYDTTKKISDADFQTLLESMRLSPSSFGLQPWKFLVIQDSETRKKLREAAWGQAQVTDASHFIVLARRTTIDEAYVDAFIETTAKIQGQKPEDLADYKNMLMGFVANTSKEALAQWAAEQVHIALGVLITSASDLDIDSSPMGGLDKAKFDEILGLKEKGLATTVVCALGYRSVEDTYHKRAKSRFPMNEIVETI